MQLLGPRLPGSEEDVVRESLEYVSLGFLAFSSVAVLLGVRTPAALTLLVLAAALVACLAVAPSLLPQVTPRAVSCAAHANAAALEGAWAGWGAGRAGRADGALKPPRV